MLRLLQTSPEDGHLNFLLANCCLVLGETDAALDYCQQCLDSSYSLENTYVVLGTILMDRKELYEAEQAFLQALSLNPLNAEGLSRYARLMFRTGHDKKAMRLLEEAKKVDPNNPDAYSEEFYHYMARSKPLEAQAALGRYVETSGDSLRTFIKMGNLALRRAQFRRAREHFRQAYLLDPTNTNLLDVLEQVDRILHPINFLNLIAAKVRRFWYVYAITIVTFEVVLGVFAPKLAERILIGIIYAYVFFFLYKLASIKLYDLVLIMKNRRR